MDINTAQQDISELATPDQAYTWPPTHCGARSTETQKLALSELLFHILIRVTVVVCLFGLAGCSTPEVSREHSERTVRTTDVDCERCVFTRFMAHPSDGSRS